MQYLVMTSEGPGFTDPIEAAEILEDAVIPTFEHLMKLEAEGKILAGGLPAGSRSFAFIVEASSNQEIDRLLRDIPAWGVFDWEATPLQSIEGRCEIERKALASMKG